MITPFDYINLFLLKQPVGHPVQANQPSKNTHKKSFYYSATVVIKSERWLDQKLIKDQPISDEQVYAKRSSSTTLRPSIY